MSSINTTERIASVDIFRAFTMLTMLFVNDFAGIPDIPHWLKHAKTTEDMLGFSDLVFPAFLFCVGLSIPFAIANRIKKGDTSLQVIWHVFVRSFILIIMGIFSMNLRGIEGGLSSGVLSMIAVTCYFLLWNVYPKFQDGRKWIFTVLKVIGAAGLIFIMLYKDLNGAPFKRGWWGILGLIGWSYAICALTYIFIKGEYKKVGIAWIVMIALSILNQLPFIPKDYSIKWVFLSFFPAGWTQAALVMSGIMGSMAMIKYADKDAPRKYVHSMFILGAIMFVLGLVCHNWWIISKNLATPTWLFFCLAIFYPILGLLFWICDANGKTRWASFVKPAGVATLTAYMLPSMWYGVMGLCHLHYPAIFCTGYTGLCRSFVFALAIIGLTWCLGKLHIKLKI